ncbi:MAG: hypothetical protein IJD40_11295 [Lachnospiraceae bacterium]|nr:hypothetical protein [Lachnospiraceae bacterium]
MEKIVVLGGSFNPPTIGHYLLMKSAMKSVDADKGIFLPASQQYVRRKWLQVTVKIRPCPMS